ncbi:hypothetical protein BC834DRAFT_385113 [Gloeopeniophorella convolvens]|nr:hypothetical protein BC834DRAFT_385113 [Gloeopeniophorella convolvens]
MDTQYQGSRAPLPVPPTVQLCFHMEHEPIRSAQLITHTPSDLVSPQALSLLHYRRAPIELLPENVLLDIFSIHAHHDRHDLFLGRHRVVWRWHRIAHVCRTWRRVVLSSPHRLNLLIHCVNGKPVADILNAWPTFPIILDYAHDERQRLTPEDEGGISYALQHPSLIQEILLPVTPSFARTLATVQWEELSLRNSWRDRFHAWEQSTSVGLPSRPCLTSSRRPRHFRP